MAVTKLQISPVIVNGFENGFHQWIQSIFLVVLDAKKCFQKNFFKIWIHFAASPVVGKPLVLELLCLEVGTSVASAVTAETGFEIIQESSAVADKPARRLRKVRTVYVRAVGL